MPFDPFFTSTAPKHPVDPEAQAECDRLRKLPWGEQRALNKELWRKIKAGERIPKGQWLFAKQHAWSYKTKKFIGIHRQRLQGPQFIYRGHNTCA